jgi:glycosyltransferase involved in cell wall biosynthesis
MGGAVEKIWHEMGSQFASRGHEVTHVSRSHHRLPATEILGGVRHVRVQGFETPRSLLALKLMDLIYTLKARASLPCADVTVTNTFWAPMLLNPKRAGAIVVSVQRMPKGQMRFYRRAARWHAVSSAVFEAVLEEQPLESERLRVIPNPLPFSAVPSEGVLMRSKEKVILYAGRLHPEKGLELLIGALRHAEMQKWLGEWRVEIVGPWTVGEGGGGEGYFSQLKSLAEGLPVAFTGPVHDPARLFDHYQRASIFVYPSLAEKGETFGVAPLEAMAFGAVPVVSDLTCFRDFIQSSRNGLVFDHRAPNPSRGVAASITELLGDEQKRISFAKAALEVNASHAPHKIAAQFLEDFSTLVGKAF